MKFRGFTKEQLIQLDKRYKNLIFTGKSEDSFFSEYNFSNKNMVNKTNINTNTLSQNNLMQCNSRHQSVGN